MLLPCQMTCKVYKFLFITLFLQILAAWHPARAAEEQAPEIAYFRLGHRDLLHLPQCNR